MASLAYNAVPLAFIVAAGCIAVSGHDGWGWCIFGAIVCHGFPSEKSE